MRVGVEVGGTFTDLVAIDGDRVRVAKVPSVPARPDDGAFAALGAGGLDLGAITDLVHGSTVGTNAVLERKGARVAFLTTAGFRDLLFLQRHDRRNIYDLAYRKPVPVVRRRDCFEVPERMLADGRAERPLDAEAFAADVVPALAAGGYQAIAVCLLNAYANPAHEEAVRDILADRLPGVPVTISAEVTREFREYERASTTTLAAFVQPVIAGYLARFEDKLAAGGFRGRFSVMQSNGGRLPAAGMRRNALTSLFSGPAAGVMGAARQAGLGGFGDLITFDMGGTSTDVCLVEGGRPQLAQETEIDGLPVRLPVLDIVTVGAGGGSVIWRDEGGMLRVGPESAGADPGPACYGRGGARPTITDAHVVRGTIRPDARLGGSLSLDAAAATAALGPLAQTFGLGLEDMADSALRVAEANIVRAIQLVTTERGRDPRDFVLVPFGGAGPLHAAKVAADLGIATICVPPNAGVISAYGLIASDYAHYDTLTRRIALDGAAPAAVADVFRAMRAGALARFAQLGLDAGARFTFALQMRFVGQAFELPVEIDPERAERLTVDELAALFGKAHESIFFHGAGGDRAIEIVAFRLGIVAPQTAVPALAEGGGDAGRTGTFALFDEHARLEGRLFARGALGRGQPLAGPALLEDATATVYVPPGWTAAHDANDNLVMRRR
ncbi:MAG: hydantoinase/oxoprolinase family protein [Alphaproteobacteria bacterium]